MPERIKINEFTSELHLSGSKPVLEELRERFRFRPEGFWRSLRYQLYVTTGGEKGWDGYIYPVKCAHKQWTAPRGYLGDIVSAIEELGHIPDTDELFERPYAQLTADQIPADLLKTNFKLDDHQRQCVAVMLAAMVGRVKVTVSGGKTEIFLACIRWLRQRWPKLRCLYITPTERLVKQVYSRASDTMRDMVVSQYGGGKSETDGDLVVATSAMLHRNLDKQADWMKKFAVVCCDECHYAASPSWLAILKSLRAIWRFAASDSMKVNSDSGAATLHGLFGPILHTVKTQAMIDLDRVAVPHVHMLRVKTWHGRYDAVPHVVEPETPVWVYDQNTGGYEKGTYLRQGLVRDEHGEETEETNGLCLVQKASGEQVEISGKWMLMERAYDKAITAFKERNHAIADIAAGFSKRGWRTLVVATRTLHCYTLNSLLADRLGEDVVQTLLGSATPSERDMTFEWFKRTKGAVLVSSLVKVGVSINEIRAGVVADHVVDHEVFNQIVGRFIRKKKDTNVAHIVMFDDIQNHTMRANAKSLKDWIRRKASGYQLHEHASVDSCLHIQ